MAKLVTLHLLHQGTVVGVGGEYAGDADDEELLAGTGDGDIELAVDGVAFSRVVCLGGDGLYDELHLCGLGDGSAVDDDVSLATLVALYGVDADTFGVEGHVEGGEVVAYEGALSAEGGDDAYRAGGVVGELIGLVELDDGLYEGGTEVCLVGVGLEALGSGGLGTGYEGGAACSHKVLHGAVGKHDVTNAANKLVGILVDAHSNELQGLLDKAAKTKAKKVNASGVEVMGSLDKMGQIALEAYNEAVDLDEKAIEDKLYEAQNDTAHPEEAEARINGLMMAREYVTDIKQKKQEIKDLQKLLKEKVKDAREGNMSRRAWKEFRKATEVAIMEDKLGVIDAYHSLIYRMSTDISKASARAKAFQKSVIDHTREIQHFANSDMQGRSASAQGELPTKYNNAVLRGLMSGAPTFQYMLKKFGEKDVDGKGYLYDYFMGAVTKAADKEFNGKYQILGSDNDPKCISLAMANARKAQVDNIIQFRDGDATKMDLPAQSGIIVCNPPYGERLMERREVEALYRDIGKCFAAFDPWQIYVLTSHEQFERLFGRRADKVRKLYNGMIPCQLYQYFKPKK